MDAFQIIATLVAGLAGGNATAAMFPDKSLGHAWNSALGLVGGVLGAKALASAFGTGADLNGLVQLLAGGGSGGALLMALTGIVVHRLKK